LVNNQNERMVLLLKKKILISTLVLLMAVFVFTPVGLHDPILAENTQVDVYEDKELVKSVVFKIGVPEYFVNGETPGVKMDAKPFIKSSRTFVPVRYLGYALGLNEQDISWDDPTKTVGLEGKSYLQLVIGSKVMKSDGVSQKMDVAPLIKKDPAERTYLPARYVAEGLGYEVDWDDANKIVVCWPKGETKPDISSVVEYIDQKAEKPPVEKPITERPEPILNNQGRLVIEQRKQFRKELEKTIVMDKENNTISFYLPVLPEGFEWDIGLNQHFGPSPDDSVYIVGRERLADGKTYVFDDIRYNEMDRGYFTFGVCKKGFVRSDSTALFLKTGEIQYRD
jgi:hypothetical protein